MITGKASESEAVCSRFFHRQHLGKCLAMAASFSAVAEGGTQASNGMRSANWRRTPASIGLVLMRSIISWANRCTPRGFTTINSTQVR